MRSTERCNLAALVQALEVKLGQALLMSNRQRLLTFAEKLGSFVGKSLLETPLAQQILVGSNQVLPEPILNKWASQKLSSLSVSTLEELSNLSSLLG